MILCPIADQHPSPVARQMAAVMNRVQAICEEQGGRARSQDFDLEQMERELQQELNLIGVACMEEVLASLDPGSEEIVVGGQRMHLAVRSHGEYLTRFGLARVQRGRYRGSCREARTICLLEDRAGIMDAFYTPAAARLVAMMMAELTIRDTQRLCLEMGVAVSHGKLGELLPRLSKEWEAGRQEHEELLRLDQAVPKEAAIGCVSVDGVFAPMKAKAASRQGKREKAGKHGSGPSGYSEVGCGTVSLHDSQGERLETIYQARMPEPKKATLSEQLKSEVLSLQMAQPQLRRVYLADGAAVNWEIAKKIEAAVEAHCSAFAMPYQEPVEIVDYFHACEHLKRACDTIFGESTPKAKAEFECLRFKLKEFDGGVGCVINALTYRRGTAKSGRKAIDSELNYFRKHKDRMKYAHYQHDNLPIGSGVVEAACKTIVTQRMKRSGMAWTPVGGQAILTLRSLIRSGRFDLGWKILRNRFKPLSASDWTYAKPRLKLAA